MIGVKPCYKYNVYTNFNPKYKDGKNKMYLEYFVSNMPLFSTYIYIYIYSATRHLKYSYGQSLQKICKNRNITVF